MTEKEIFVQKCNERFPKGSYVHWNGKKTKVRTPFFRVPLAPTVYALFNFGRSNWCIFTPEDYDYNIANPIPCK